MLDIRFDNVTIIDGTGKPGFLGLLAFGTAVSSRLGPLRGERKKRWMPLAFVLCLASLITTRTMTLK